jgi:hypothetical protein
LSKKCRLRLRGRGRLRPAASPRDGLARHVAGAGVAEVGLLCAATRVGIGKPHRRALSVTDLVSALIANQNSFPRQITLL